MKTDRFKDAGECWKVILGDVKRNAGFLKAIKRFAIENTSPAEITFGTSGWGDPFPEDVDRNEPWQFQNVFASEASRSTTRYPFRPASTA